MRRIVLFMMLVATTMAFAVHSGAAQAPNLKTVAVFAAAPAIDGVLNDAAWLQAAQWGAKVAIDHDNLSTRVAIMPRTGYIAYDANNLYVGVFIPTADSGKLVSNAASYWNNDEVEVFVLAPNAANFFKITVVCNGDYYETNGKGEAYAAVGKTANSWSAEIAIPFSTLGQTPSAGDTWRFNVAGHVVADEDMWITWNSVYGQFANTNRFGELTFITP